MDLIYFLPLVSFLIAVFTAPAGVSGAFLLLPFQVSVLGFTSPSVSPTNLVYNLFAIPSGVYRYTLEKRMVWPLVFVVVLATLPGVFIGARLRTTYFLDPKTFKFFVGLVLLYLGYRVLESILRNPHPRIKEIERKFKEKAKLSKDAIVRTKKLDFLKIEYEFWGESFSFNPVIIFFLSFFIGIIGGIYGVGGGAILSPILVSYFSLPTYTIAGATLMGTFLTSIFGVIAYYQLGYSPDWKIGILLGIGGVFGVYFGARIQKYLPEKLIRMLIAFITLGTALNYIAQYFL